MTHTYKFHVTMTCGGCSGAVDRVLKKLDGVESYDVCLETQHVTVVTALPFETVHGKIAKTGKKVNWATVDGEERSLEVLAAEDGKERSVEVLAAGC